jgi:hypothetical protein
MNEIKDRCLIMEIYSNTDSLFTFTVFMSSVFIYVQVSVDDSKEEEIHHNSMR